MKLKKQNSIFKWADFGNDIHIGAKISGEQGYKGFATLAEYHRDYYNKNKHKYKGMEKHKDK